MPGAGHAHPMLSVARALQQRGNDVVFASGDDHEQDAARDGVPFLAFPIGGGSPVHALRPHEDARNFAVKFAPMVRDLAPDVCVVDLVTIGAALASEAAGVPYATLSIHPLHLPSRDLPPFGWGHPRRGGIFRLQEAWMRNGTMRDLARARDALNGARRDCGLPPTDRVEGHLSSDCILVATLPVLEIARGDWPSHAHVVGPCLWNPPGEDPADPPGDTPLVLIAASTAIEQGALVRVALDAVAACGARAILTTGKSAPPAEVPPGVVVSAFADHDAVLARADAVVCNGGHGIVARALMHGVPLVVVPGGGDQRENGYRVERARAGLRVMRPDTRALTEALARVLKEPAFADAARRIAAEPTDGPARAAELVEALGARDHPFRPVG